MNISSWLFSVLGVVLLGVLVDLLLPNGKLNGFTRAIFGFFTLVVIITPFPKMINKEIDLSTMIFNNATTEIDQDYLEVMTDKIIKTIENDLEKRLENAGFLNVDVIINYNLEKYAYKINFVSLNIKNLVINGNIAHINKYTEMVQVVTGYVDVEEDNVKFNE